MYGIDPILPTLIPRGFSIFLDSNGELITYIRGMDKFSGNSVIDDDDHDIVTKKGEAKTVDADEAVVQGEAKKGEEKTLFNEEEVMEWANKGELEIYSTEKANGKFAICRFLKFHGIEILIYGSKNNHKVVSLSEFREAEITGTEIIDEIGRLIQKQVETLLPLFQEENTYSLVGEHEDGHHFTEATGLRWFGLFNGKRVKDLTEYSSVAQIKPELVFQIGDPIDRVKKILFAPRMAMNEGSVLLFRHTGGEERVCKAKSAWYIVQRMTREIMKKVKTKKNANTLQEKLQAVTQGILDKAEYTKLTDAAGQRATEILLEFCNWFHESYPPQIVPFCRPAPPPIEP